MRKKHNLYHSFWVIHYKISLHITDSWKTSGVCTQWILKLAFWGPTGYLDPRCWTGSIFFSGRKHKWEIIVSSIPYYFPADIPNVMDSPSQGENPLLSEPLVQETRPSRSSHVTHTQKNKTRYARVYLRRIWAIMKKAITDGHGVIIIIFTTVTTKLPRQNSNYGRCLGWK